MSTRGSAVSAVLSAAVKPPLELVKNASRAALCASLLDLIAYGSEVFSSRCDFTGDRPYQ